MKAPPRPIVIASLSIAGLFIFLVAGFFVWSRWQYHLPSDDQVRQYFQSHRPDFIRFAELLEKDPIPKRITQDGVVKLLIPPASRTTDFGYQELMSRTGAREVFIRPNGTIEFELWGFGCAPCTDSFKGMLYVPAGSKSTPDGPWDPRFPKSLDDQSLPKENGAVSDGLYVLPLEAKWFIYRLQID